MYWVYSLDTKLFITLLIITQLWVTQGLEMDPKNV